MALVRLWRGGLPLPEAFWTWAVLVGLLVNVSTSILFLWLVMAAQPAWLLAAVYVGPILYNVVAATGVWRSAGRDDADPRWAGPARVVAVLGLAALSLT